MSTNHCGFSVVAVVVLYVFSPTLCAEESKRLRRYLATISFPFQPYTYNRWETDMRYGCLLYQRLALPQLSTYCYQICCQPVPVVPLLPFPIPTVQPTTTPDPLRNFGYCYDGQRSDAKCSTQNGCPSLQICVNGLCCAKNDNVYKYACGGLTALASCSPNGICPVGLCTSSNYCCECEYGQAGGICTPSSQQNAGCPKGYICNAQHYCCPRCSDGDRPYGSCYKGICPDGYRCSHGNICCKT